MYIRDNTLGKVVLVSTAGLFAGLAVWINVYPFLNEGEHNNITHTKHSTVTYIVHNPHYRIPYTMYTQSTSSQWTLRVSST